LGVALYLSADDWANWLNAVPGYLTLPEGDVALAVHAREQAQGLLVSAIPLAIPLLIAPFVMALLGWAMQHRMRLRMPRRSRPPLLQRCRMLLPMPFMALAALALAVVLVPALRERPQPEALVSTGAVYLLGALALLSLLDVLFAHWLHRRALRMTRQQLLDEARDLHPRRSRTEVDEAKR
jgi:flagellar biosynthesis protein FlhB